MSFEGTPTQVALIRDVTEQRVAEEHSAHGSRLAALGSMAASIGHEINNPLSYLIGNLEAALEEQDEQVRRQVLTEARDGARRIHQIVTDLRAFTRLDPSAPMEAVDVTSAVTAAVNLTGNQLRHRARLVRSHDAGCVAWAKEGPLVQVLVNLLLNAAQSLSGDRLDHEVRVTSRRIGSEVEVMVEDTGVGIPPEVVPRIFEPFFTTRPRQGGAGLGLSVSRRIIDGFGGTITAESEVGKGTVFRIRLPLSPEAKTPVAPPIPVVPSGKGRILLVDDEPLVARALGRMLKEQVVELCTDAQVAMDRLIGGEAVDVVLCDLMMPGVTGAMLYEAVVAVRPELASRFLFTTGGAFGEPAVAFAERHAGRVLEKPIGVERLREAVRRVLDGTPTGAPPAISG